MSKWNKKPWVENCEDGSQILHYSGYWDNGRMIILREALDADHPEHLYNYLKSEGIKPEDFGIYCPVEQGAREKFGSMTKEELIKLCWDLSKELDALYRAGF